MELTLLQKISVYALPVIFAITVHEAAHGYVARYFGDYTADKLGRISLNPLRHIDPLGTILVPLLSLALGGILFGWAKPVPVNFSRLRHPKTNMLWVALAGPAANFGMALLWALLLLMTPVSERFSLPFSLMSQAGITINLVLMILNLLPLLPLDGGRIALSLLPSRYATLFARSERYGFFILLLLLMSGVLGAYISGPVEFLYHLLVK